MSASNWRALADSRADAASARARSASTPPTWKICSCRSAGVKYKPARSAVRVPLAGSASTTLASAQGSALAAPAETGCACVGERVPDSATSTNARCPPGVVNEHALSTTKRKREMSRGPFGSSWIAKSWPSRRQA